MSTDDQKNNANIVNNPADSASQSGEPAKDESADTAAADAKRAGDAAAAVAGGTEAPDKPADNAAAKEVPDKATDDAAATETPDKATPDTTAKKAADKAADKDDEPRPCTEREKIFTWLTVGQYLILGSIGVIIVYFLFSGLLGNNTTPFLFALAKPEVARGVITFLVAAGTVSLAVLLVMAAIMSSGSKDLEHRFAFGKEVLTLLIGILGTIVGFYYGSTKDNATPLTVSPVALSEAKIGGTFTLDAVIIGGTSPYTYSIKFDPANIIPDVIDQQSAGPIHHEFTVPTTAKADEKITFTIEVKDAKEQTFTYNQDGKQSITLKPAEPTSSTPGT